MVKIQFKNLIKIFEANIQFNLNDVFKFFI